MPYARKTKKTTRKGKGKPRMPRSSYKTVQKIVNRTLMKKSETKMFPLEVDATLIGPDDTGYLTTLSSVASGTDNENRNGDSIYATGCNIKYYFENQSSNPFNYLVRIVIFKSDKGQFNDNTDSFLLSTANEPLALTANDNLDIIRSLNKRQHGMKVLFDKVHKISSSTTTTTGNQCVFRNLFFKFKTKRYFTVDGNNESEYNNLRCLVVVRDAGGDTVSINNDIAFTLMSRYYYKDF